MMAAKIKVTKLASITGKLLVAMPYTSHIKVPKVNRVYMVPEMAEVSFVFTIFKACGKKDIVVQQAAINPDMGIQFIRVKIKRDMHSFKCVGCMFRFYIESFSYLLCIYLRIVLLRDRL